jgi:hypothetical protein
MKTTTQINSVRNRDEFIAGTRRLFPLIEANYHADLRGSTFSAPDRAELRRFRKLSGDFFGKETPRDYVRELTLFGIIIAVTAWPIVSMIQALAGLLK